jgi:hypothetical protein
VACSNALDCQRGCPGVPGIYTVLFTLPGFRDRRVENIGAAVLNESMRRRTFFSIVPGLAILGGRPGRQPTTECVILIVNGGGVRKKEYYEDAHIARNMRRIAAESFVFEQDHCEHVGSHETAFAELLHGRECVSGRSYPTMLDYIGRGVAVDRIEEVPQLLQRTRPRIIVCRLTAHDVGHQSYEDYLKTASATDEAIGRLFDFIKHSPDFSRNTSIVIRPEFGRDDELSANGQLHHSYGFYYTHRVASIFWGPDFNQGVDRKTIITALDMAPTLAKLFRVDAKHAQGRVVPGLFRA